MKWNYKNSEKTIKTWEASLLQKIDTETPLVRLADKDWNTLVIVSLAPGEWIEQA